MGPVLLVLGVGLVAGPAADPVSDTAAEPDPIDAPASESPPVLEDEPAADGLPSYDSAPAPADPFAAAGSTGGPYQPPPGGSGEVTTTSGSLAQPGPPPPLQARMTMFEVSTRVEAGYGRYDLGNRSRLDHQGASLRVNFAVFLGADKAARIGYGVGLGYAYQGFGRKVDDADFPVSRGQQHQFFFTLNTIFHVHPQLFSIQISPLVGTSFYGFRSGDSLLIENRPAWIEGTEQALMLGGTMGLCTAWDIVCVIGGADIARNVDSYPVEDMSFFATYAITSFWGWHLALGFDVARIFQRSNRMAVPY